MAVILAFALPTRTRAEAAYTHDTVGGLRATGAFHWLRDSQSGKLVCRWDVEAADPEPRIFLKSA